MRPLRCRLVTGTPGGSGIPPGRHYDRSARSSLNWPGANAGFKKRGLEPTNVAVERREARLRLANGDGTPRSSQVCAHRVNLSAACRAAAPAAQRRLARALRFPALRFPSWENVETTHSSGAKCLARKRTAIRTTAICTHATNDERAKRNRFMESAPSPVVRIESPPCPILSPRCPA